MYAYFSIIFAQNWSLLTLFFGFRLQFLLNYMTNYSPTALTVRCRGRQLIIGAPSVHQRRSFDWRNENGNAILAPPPLLEGDNDYFYEKSAETHSSLKTERRVIALNAE